ncbi:MAG: chemotaxis response regulator protein-glutamate methylesterase [Oscillospiraceae bacterium]|nr:chemotaxis response regulator protein-glutamate methylesterase [Oscillospiraceae bacterium]
MNRIKLLVVDDSILFREVLSRYIKNDSSIEIVGKAGDAYSARDMILKYEPDVMTLDIEMPKMDGIAFLKKLLPQYYIPTIVVSSSEKQKKDCLSAGAVDFLTKPSNQSGKNIEAFAADLCNAIHRAYNKSNNSSPKTDVKEPEQKPAENKAKPQNNDTTDKRPKTRSKIIRSNAIIALGASTGGTEALVKVVKEFPADTPPVLIVQHMPAGFTKMYAERLDRICKMDVKEAEDGDRLRKGLIILGAGEFQLRLQKDNKGYYVSSKPGERVSGHCPSVDVLFNSVAEAAGPDAIGAIFTGMGRDGADGLLKMRKAGAFTIGQDKETCVVYGMPMEAYNIGAVEVQAPLEQIAKIILDDLL